MARAPLARASSRSRVRSWCWRTSAARWKRYSRLLLYFLHGVIQRAPRDRPRTRVGAKDHARSARKRSSSRTRLTRITRALQRRDVDAALAHVAARVVDWSGGTRIGESLHVFNRDWARRVLGTRRRGAA